MFFFSDAKGLAKINDCNIVEMTFYLLRFHSYSLFALIFVFCTNLLKTVNICQTIEGYTLSVHLKKSLSKGS